MEYHGGADGSTRASAGMAPARERCSWPPAGVSIAYQRSALTPRAGLALRITGGPDGPQRATGGTFTFTSGTLTPTQCRLDGKAWHACAGSETFAELADGSHTFEVRTVDGAGGDRCAGRARLLGRHDRARP